MSRKILNNPYVRHLGKSSRHQSVCLPRPDYGPMDVQRSSLMNGCKVTSVKPMGAPMGTCTIMFQAGSRFEVDDQIGVSHFLRACSPASGCGYSAFSKTRVMQQLGAYITCSSDRQSIAYTIRCPSYLFSDVKYYLFDIAARSHYTQHEIDDRKSLIKLDLQRVHPEQLVLDLVQKACWAGPLSNSVFCEENRIDDMSADSMNSFTLTQFRTDVCTLASVGVPFDEVVMLAEQMDFRRKQVFPCDVPPPVPRGGFEYHDLGPNTETYIALAVPGCGTNDLSTLMTHSIVAAACGTGSMEKGQHDQDRTPQAPLGTVAYNDVFTELKAFNISYADAGVFGILIKTHSAMAWDVSLRAADFLRNIHQLDATHAELGKKRLSLDIAINDDDCVRMSEGLALATANDLCIDSANSSLCLIDAITPGEICEVAKTLAGKVPRQLAVAVVGDVQAVPHDRELRG